LPEMVSLATRVKARTAFRRRSALRLTACSPRWPIALRDNRRYAGPAALVVGALLIAECCIRRPDPLHAAGCLLRPERQRRRTAGESVFVDHHQSILGPRSCGPVVNAHGQWRPAVGNIQHSGKRTRDDGLPVRQADVKGAFPERAEEFKVASTGSSSGLAPCRENALGACRGVPRLDAAVLTCAIATPVSARTSCDLPSVAAIAYWGGGVRSELGAAKTGAHIRRAMSGAASWAATSIVVIDRSGSRIRPSCVVVEF
jgi:hypothetical protein